MLTRRLKLAAQILFMVAGLLFTTAFVLRLFFIPTPEQPVLEKQEAAALPVFWKYPHKEDFQAPFLALEFSPASPRLPDLRRVVIYFGKNNRPDADPKNPTMFFGLMQDRKPIRTSENSPLYLKYSREKIPPQYIFSTDNQETNLWFKAKPKTNQVEVSVYMKDELGRIIEEPTANHLFNLTEQDLLRYGTMGVRYGWEIGTLRVDGTLLVRQKARWYGSDKFLERHGGKEYEDMANKQRIDFGDGANAYSVFVAVGDCLVWEDGRWVAVKPGPESLGKSLLVVKKIEERLMLLELWDPEGAAKVLLNLVKSMEMWGQQNLEKTFRFIGAKTRSQFVFEINKKRFVLSPNDWLLFSDGKWKKIETIHDIDAYVNREMVGILFVFEGMKQVDDRWILKGIIYNPSRTIAQEIELPQGDNKTIKNKQKTTPIIKQGSKDNPSRSPEVDEEDDDSEDDEEADDMDE